jgi:hypothetical protein
MVDLNPALRAYQENRFTDDDIVGCTGLTTRALRELLKVGAVRSITERRGPGLVRLFDTTTLKRAAIIAALHGAGFSLATAGRIAYFVPFEELLFAVCDPFTVLFMHGTPLNPETGLPRPWPEPRANWFGPNRAAEDDLKMIGCWRFTNADSLARCTKSPASQINPSSMPTCAMMAQDLCCGSHFMKNGLFSTCR